MNLSNKKITRPIKHTVSGNNVEAFLAYCAYDIRWNLTGNAPPVNKNAAHTFLSNPKGETSKQNYDTPVGAGRALKLSKKII